MRRAADRPSVCIAALAILLLLTAVAPIASAEGEFYYEPVRTDTIGGRTYVALTDIARIFSDTTTWHWRDKKVVLAALDLTLLIDSPIVLHGETGYNLFRPTRIIDSQIFVPPTLVTDIIASITDQQIDWQPESNRYRFPALPATVTDIETEVTPEETNVVLRLTEPLKYRLDRLLDGSYMLSLENGRLSSVIPTRYRRFGKVRSINLKQTPIRLQATFRLEPDITRHHVELLRDPYRLNVRFQTSRYDSSAQEVVEQSIGGVLAGRDKFDVVVIDPGHGGKHPGALGRSYKTPEKEITLKIAKILARQLRQQLGLTVILTRETDRFIGLWPRTEIANKYKADLFISIHCNSNRSRRVGGFEVYYLGHAKTNHARAVAQMENEAVDSEVDGTIDKNLKELGFILWDLAQNAYLEESSLLAEDLNNAMSRVMPIRSRGVRQAVFDVLIGAFMPSVLVEAAYLSNRNEERFLRSAEGQQQVAQAIVEGIRAYKQQFERRLKPVD
jgi:N-acetylmuramoyl-L-alanine amidase